VGKDFWKTICLLFGIFVLVAICISLCISTTGCASNRVDPTILEYQRKVDALESRIRCYEQTTDYAIRELETISRGAEEMGGTVEELISLFDEYQRTVERILLYYRKTESKTESTVNNSSDSIDNINH